MAKVRILPWLVELSLADAAALASARPGDLPNLIYELRQWLDLEPGEPLDQEARELSNNTRRLQKIIDSVAELLGAVADSKLYHADYAGGSVILDAAKLASEGGRALSYRDASLEDAVLRLALDDLAEAAHSALRIRRCREPECGKIFFAVRKNQLYCGHRCANRMTSRVYRSTHRKERAARERERYVRDVKKRTASSVVVARRGRTLES